MPARRTPVSWRSGLEESNAALLRSRGISFTYEQRKLKWLPEVKMRTYTPDFEFTSRSGKQIIVETKGYWTADDRAKMLAVVTQHPDLDIRIVFSNPNQKIRKGSKTSYAEWCQKFLKIPWAKGLIPEEWLLE
jgi:predicted nuclease of restriction endonuclease-like RecB superfamily